MAEGWQDLEFLRHVFDETRVVRKPLTGIITGYHVLPYIIVGPEEDRPHRSVEVRGRIKVSPRLVISPREVGLTYGEFFAERELMDQAIVALLQLRRGQVPGDATLDQSAVLRFEYTTPDEATPEVAPPEDITPE